MSDQQEKESPAKAAKKEEAPAPTPASAEQPTPAGTRAAPTGKPASAEQPRPAGTRAAPQGSEPGLAPGEASPNPAQGARVRAMVYIGPARPFGVPLMRGAILRGEPAAVIPALGEAMQAHPALARLFVPVAQLAQARQDLARAGSGLAIIYRDIQTASARARTA